MGSDPEGWRLARLCPTFSVFPSPAQPARSAPSLARQLFGPDLQVVEYRLARHAVVVDEEADRAGGNVSVCLCEQERSVHADGEQAPRQNDFEVIGLSEVFDGRGVGPVDKMCPGASLASPKGVVPAAAELKGIQVLLIMGTKDESTAAAMQSGGRLGGAIRKQRCRNGGC